MKTTGEKIKELRIIRGFSQRDLAEKIKELGGKISFTYIADLETGKALNPSLEKLEWIAKALGVDIEYFRSREPVPLLKYVEHFPPELQEFLSKQESVAWVDLAKGFAEADLTPEDFKEIGEFIRRRIKK